MKQIMTAAVVLTALSSLTFASSVKAQQRAPLDNPNIAVDLVPSPKFKAIYKRFEDRKVLPQIKQFLAPLQLEPLRQDGTLDGPLMIRVRECTQKKDGDVSNAWYSSGETEITYCYAYIQGSEKDAPKVRTEEGLTREDAVDGAFLGTLFHELGHAVIDLFKVPVYGREEDAADQISAFVMLQFGPNVARRTILARANTYRERYRRDPTSILYDEHATNLQRFYNYLCLGYGGFPDEFKDLVDRPLKGANAEQKFLPSRRAANCKNEYEQVRHAFATSLKPHLDMTLVDRVKATIGCIPANGRWAIEAKC
jgi:hypothetical protein